MSFTASGTNPVTITQTGTDTDLSGLSGLTSATHINETYIDIYILDQNTELDVQGTLRISPLNEQLICQRTPNFNNHAIKVTNGGILNLGNEIVLNGFTDFSSGRMITFDNDAGGSNDFNFRESWANLYIDNGTLNWYGGEIFSRGVIAFTQNSIVNIFSQNALFTAGGNEPQIRQRSSACTVNGFTLKKGLYTSIEQPLVFNNYEPIQSNSAIDFSSSSISGSFYVYKNLIAGNGNSKEVGGKNDIFAKLLNTNNGTNIIVDTQDGSTGADQLYLIESRKEIIFNCKNENNNSLSGVKTYFFDTNHGSRLSAGIIAGSNDNYTNSIIYSGISDNNGYIDFTGENNSILLGVHYFDGISKEFDSRGNNNDTSDIFTSHFIEYQKEIVTQNIILKNIDISNEDISFLPDLDITEIDKSIVDAYTSIDNPEEFYDRAKSYLYDNYLGESNTLVNKNGSEIDAGNFDVDIDANATNAFDVSGNKITIQTNTFVGDLTTNGVITLLNGATFNGTRTDTNGTILPPASYTLDFPNILDGSRIQTFNVTSNTEIDNFVLSNNGNGLNVVYILGTEYNAGDQGRYRITYVNGTTAKEEIEGFFTFLSTTTTNSLPLTQKNDEIYNLNAIDGSILTNFEADIANEEIDVKVAQDFKADELYAWFKYNSTTQTGIKTFFGAFKAKDIANYELKNNIIDIFLDNTTNTNIKQIDNKRIFRTDGNYPVLQPGSGMGGIDLVWRNQIFIAETSTSGLTPTESTKLNSIPNNTLLNNDSRLDNLDDPVSKAIKAAKIAPFL